MSTGLEDPSAVAAAAAAGVNITGRGSPSSGGDTGGAAATPPSRYEAQKRRDWNTFGQYLKNHRPPLALARCSGANVLEFLRYLDQFGKTKIHAPACPFFGIAHPPAPCACPLRQAWGSLDALIGRLRAAFEEHGGKPESNPFGARAVRLYLREVREMQAKARGIAYEKKKRKRPNSSNNNNNSNNSSSSNNNNNINAGLSSNNNLSSTSSSSNSNSAAAIGAQHTLNHHHAAAIHPHHPHHQLQQQHHNPHHQHQPHILQVNATLPLIQHQHLQQLQHPQQQFLPQSLQPGASCLQILN